MWFYLDAAPEVIQQNKDALGEGFDILESAAELHHRALLELDRLNDDSSSNSRLGERLLAYHALNLLVDAANLVLKGSFDTFEYLLRPLYDLGPVMLVVGRDEALAEDMLTGRVEASAARKRIVQLTREAGFAEEAEQLAEDWRTTSSQVQASSHVGIRQLQGLLLVLGDEARPILGGGPDHDSARSKGRILVASEMRTLSYLLANHREELEPDLVHEIDKLFPAATAWLRAADAS